MAGAMREQMNTIQTDLATFAMEPLPYDGIVAWAAKAKRKSLEAAEAVALEVATNRGETPDVGVSGDKKDGLDTGNADLSKKHQDEQAKVKSNEDKILNIKAGNSKKLAAIQDAIRIKNLVKEKAAQLKIALGDGWVAIQKAWASAPFPLNLPAVGLATVSTAANVASIAGLEKGGDVGTRSIVEVGEKNKPELLNFEGKNFLLGGNGGSVFNQSQLEQVGGGNNGGSFSYSPSFTVMDGSGVAGILEQQQETLYNIMVSAKADRGEVF
jgi:hypothetical protein